MKELSQLGQFVRLADYLFVEAVMATAVESVEELLGVLTAHKQQVGGSWSWWLEKTRCCSCVAHSVYSLAQHNIGVLQLTFTTTPVATATCTQADKTKALFQVSVAFEPHGMAFTPNEAAILDEINANTLEGIVAVAQVGWGWQRLHDSQKGVWLFTKGPVFRLGRHTQNPPC